MAPFAYEAGLRLGMAKKSAFIDNELALTMLGTGVGAVGGGIIGAVRRAKTRKQRVLNALKGVGIGGLAGGGLGLAGDSYRILRDTVDDYIDRFQPPDVRHPYFDFDWLPGANTRGVTAGLAGLGIGATGANGAVISEQAGTTGSQLRQLRIGLPRISPE